MDDKQTEGYKRLQELVAMKHGYKLSDDDPILIFVTLNEMLLEQYKSSFNDTLDELSDIVFNTKADVQTYIKEQEIALFIRIQDINNKNVENVNNRIKEYFIQEAVAYKNLNTNHTKSNKILTSLVLLNAIISIILVIMIIMIIMK